MKEKTLVVIKPDGIERNLVGTIISYYEKGGMKVIAMKTMMVTKELVAKHYPDDEEYLITLGKKSEKAGDVVKDYKQQGKMIVEGVRRYITRGPVIAIILEGENAIKRVREITGYTDPKSADKGTIRGDFGKDSILEANSQKRSVQNLIHASGTPDEAKKEIKLWFPEMK